ncbi:hypothetical protein Tco_0750698 [Tanacetum coccineum]|uniref:Retrovirus-related Pol polyprotein from transposon TNT 1-94-like beta-barrel domain-containing protein n=1 Tax=Tanacetum coccineum TaxID=301880 RepID=A0ABQ4Z4Q9_9ASTR
MYVLPYDQINSVINCLTAKSTWDGLILYHEGPSDVKESRVMYLKLCYNTFNFKEGESLTQTFTRYKALMNELVNDGIKLSKHEINTGFINRLPKKWLSFCQSLRNTNYMKDSELASLFGKLKYEENLIDNSTDDEEDTRTSQEYLNDLEEEYQAGALLAKSKRFFKKGYFARDCWSKTSVSTYQSPFQSKPFISPRHKPELRPTKDFEAKYNKVKAKLALPSLSASASKGATIKNKCLIVEAYEWDEEEVSSDDNEMVEVKVLMVHTLLEMEDNDDRKTYLDYLCIYLNYVEEQRNNLLSKHKDLVHELNACKEQLLVLKQAKLDFFTMQHVNTKILKENKNLRIELKKLIASTETWLNSSNKVNQCINEQIPYQKKRIMGADQLNEDPSSSRPWLSEAEGFILPNHDTGRILPAESQRNTTDPLIAVTDSSATDYDSKDESSVCSTPLPPLKKLDGAEPISGPKTIKSILKSKSKFKVETLKGVIINEPSPTPAKDNKSSSASKVNSTPAGKLKSVKIKDDLPLAIDYLSRKRDQSKILNMPSKDVKLVCDIGKPIWYLDSGCLRHMTGVKSYLHKYVEQPGPKVMFGDDSTCTTKGYGSIKCNGIVFTKVAFVNGLKYNIISISQLCDDKYIVQFDEKRGTIFNSNKEVVMIAPGVRDVYVLNMTYSAQESCFFAKAFDNLNWL